MSSSPDVVKKEVPKLPTQHEESTSQSDRSSGSDIPPHDFGHGHGLGIGIALVAWAIEVKEGLVAILQPFANCDGILQAVFTLFEMPSGPFAGEVTWLAIILSSTVALALYLKGRC